MSTENKTWLGRVFATIAALFMNNYESWLKKLWINIAEDLKPDLIVIVGWIEKIKSAVDSPVLDAFVAAIPGDKDDKVLSLSREFIDWLLKELRIEDKSVNQLTESDKQSIATLVTKEVTGLPFDQASTTIKTAYWNLVKLA